MSNSFKDSKQAEWDEICMTKAIPRRTTKTISIAQSFARQSIIISTDQQIKAIVDAIAIGHLPLSGTQNAGINHLIRSFKFRRRLRTYVQKRKDFREAES